MQATAGSPNPVMTCWRLAINTYQLAATEYALTGRSHLQGGEVKLVETLGFLDAPQLGLGTLWQRCSIAASMSVAVCCAAASMHVP